MNEKPYKFIKLESSDDKDGFFNVKKEKKQKIKRTEKILEKTEAKKFNRLSNDIQPYISEKIAGDQNGKFNSEKNKKEKISILKSQDKEDFFRSAPNNMTKSTEFHQSEDNNFEEKETTNKVLNILIDNYVDQEGNMLDVCEDSRIYGKISSDYWKEKEEFYRDGELIDELEGKIYSSETTLKEKIICLKILNDISISCIKDADFGTGSFIRNDGYFSLQKKDSKKYPIILTFLANQYLDENKSWDDFINGLIFYYEENAPERILNWKLSDYHEEDFNDYDFYFNSDMADKIYVDRSDDNMFFDELKPIRNIIDSEGNEEVIDGDFVISHLSPDLIGVYTLQGNLVGWEDVDNFKNKKNENNKWSSEGDFVVNFKNVSNIKDKIDNFDIFYFKIIESLPFKHQIKEKLGIDLSDLSLGYQYQFLNFIKTYNQNDFQGVLEFINNSINNQNKINRIKSFLSLSLDQEMGERILNIGNSLENDPELADSLFSKYSQIVDNSEKNIREVEKIYQEIFFDKNINQQKLREIILIKAKDLLLVASKKLKEAKNNQEKEDIVRETINNLEIQERANKKNLEEIKDIFYELKASNLISEKVDLYQKNLESKLENLIYGQESAELPNNFQENISQDILNYQPELNPNQETYLPVGVSSQLPQEGELHQKPIDALVYLFWLQNQQKKSEFIVVDTIQENNYQDLYGLDQAPAREKALENGRRDKQWYQKIKDTFDLNNINFVSYQEIEDSSEKKEKEKLIIQIEKISPLIKKALDSLVEKSVDQKSKGGGDKDISGYGREEIAFTLAVDKQKIGHQKEYRYDILSRIIPVYQELSQRKENILEEYKLDLRNKNFSEKAIKSKIMEIKRNIDQFLVDLSLYLTYYQDYPEEYQEISKKIFGNKAQLTTEQNRLNILNKEIKKNKKKIEKLNLKSEVPQNAIQFIARKVEGQISQAEELKKKIENEKIDQKELKEEVKSLKIKKRKVNFLNKIKKEVDKLGLSKSSTEDMIYNFSELSEKINNQQWFINLDLPNFHYSSQVTGMSFEMSNKLGKEFIGFREFYSTIKSSNKRVASIEANQVIASTDQLAAAKLLVLSKENQIKYFNKVLRPLLINYYLATSGNKTEAQKRFKSDIRDCHTIHDIISLIQEKIISPIEKKKLSKEIDL